MTDDAQRRLDQHDEVLKAHQAKIDHVQERGARHEARIEALERRADYVNEQLGALRAESTEHHRTMRDAFDTMQRQVSTMSGGISAVKWAIGLCAPAAAAAFAIVSELAKAVTGT